MLSPVLHCIVITLTMLVILCRYFVKNFGHYPALIKYEKENVPSYMYEYLKNYFKKGASFQRCLAALILSLPFFIGSAFIIVISVDYFAYTELKMNSWALIRDAYEISIKNDPDFMYNFGIVTLVLMGFIIAFTLLYTVCKSTSVHKEKRHVSH